MNGVFAGSVDTEGGVRLTGDLARQETALRAAEAAEVFWELRARTAMAWYEIYAADRQLAVMQETLDWLRQFADIAATMYSVGTGTQSDVLRAGVEVAEAAEVIGVRDSKDPAGPVLLFSPSSLRRRAAMAVTRRLLPRPICQRLSMPARRL